MALSAKDLRIGNYIKINKKWLKDNPKLYNTKKVIKIKTLNYDELDRQYYPNGYGFYYLEPILITSEILSKTDLEKMSDTFFYFWKSSMFSISKIVGKWEICICSENTICRVKYLHELQNLYFALTGSELVFSTEP